MRGISGGFRLHPTSTVIHDRTYYLPTYLHEKDNQDGQSWLMMRRIVAWATKGGKHNVRAITDVFEYPTGDLMVADIEAHPEWIEAPTEADGNPQWVPEDMRSRVQ